MVLTRMERGEVGIDDDLEVGRVDNIWFSFVLAPMQCVMQNTTDISKCQFYVDMLNDCKKNPETGFTPTPSNTVTLIWLTESNDENLLG